MVGSFSSKSHADGAAFKRLPNFRSEKSSARSSSEMYKDAPPQYELMEPVHAVEEREERNGQEGYAQEALGVPGVKGGALGEMSKNDVVDGGDSEDLEIAIGFAKVGIGEERDEREEREDERDEDDTGVIVSENMVGCWCWV